MTTKELEIQLALGSLSIWDKIELVVNSKSKNILTILSTDEDSYVREYIAFNPNAPIDILKRLSKDENIYVRRHIACNPNTPIEVLKKLSKDKDKYVRYNAKD